MANRLVAALRRLAWNFIGPPPSRSDEAWGDFKKWLDAPVVYPRDDHLWLRDSPRIKFWTEGATYRFPESVERVRFVKQASTEVIGSGEITSKGI